LKAKISDHYRFYVPSGYPDDRGVVRFSRAESRHMTASLRARVGDNVTATDGLGNLYRLKVESTSGQEVSATVTSVESVKRAAPAIHLFQGVIKPASMELVVEKATELGLWGLTPVVSARAESSPGRIKTERLRKAAIEAMKQSLGAHLPEIRDAVSFGRALEEACDFDSVLVAWEGGSAPALHRAIDDCRAGRVALWVGPSGGFTQSEMARLEECGGVAFALGRQRLKSETAAIASLAILRHLLSTEGS
jgi:16S rRNA (uracil1498-N3)-methyltransferase